jgi:hypothetical protein
VPHVLREGFDHTRIQHSLALPARMRFSIC